MMPIPLHHYTNARMALLDAELAARRVPDEWVAPRRVSRRIGRTLVVLGARLLGDEDISAAVRATPRRAA